MPKFHDLPFGYIGSYDDNEVEIVSTMSDPPKIRLAVDADKVESNLGSVSFNLRRSDGRHEEMAYIMGRLTADKQAGALYLATRAPGAEQAEERLYIDHTAAIFRVPVIGAGGASSILQSPNGRLQLAAQNDDNLRVPKVT